MYYRFNLAKFWLGLSFFIYCFITNSVFADPIAPTGASIKKVTNDIIIFSWLPDQQTPEAYEILRDGHLLKVIDGNLIGYIDSSLEARSYQYQVIAVDENGNRSSPLSATIDLSNSNEPPATAASLHNVIRHALNNQMTMDNLGVYLDQSYDFSQEPKPNPALPDMIDDVPVQATVKQYASQCIYKHSSNGNGENLFAGTGNSWTLEHAINAWGDEVRDYDYDSNQCTDNKKCKHYTQMIWENSTNVGCAVQACSSIGDGNGNTIFSGASGTLIICQYSPAGNIIGSQPYRTESDTPLPETGIKFSLKAMLQGSYDPTNGNMKDDLRQQNRLPQQEPYTQLGHNVTGNLQLSPDLLSIDGNNAIIDWIIFELRDKNNPSTILVSTVALLQQDGDLVDPSTGSSNIHITSLAADEYYIAIRHRNHLGIMTSEPIHLSSVTSTIDFTDAETQMWGENARLKIQPESEKKAVMWAGDANHDGKVIAAGEGNDINSISADILLAPTNTGFNSNYIVSSYGNSDLSLDGDIILAGDKNDENIIRGNVLLNPANTNFNRNFIAKEQLPE